MDNVTLARELCQTQENRQRLFRNRNLLYWYKRLYSLEFAGEETPEKKDVLEIGSGTSPLKFFYRSVTTSDILPLPYLDCHFDCHAVDTAECLGGRTFDIISLTNVLHHLHRPLDFLKKASARLRPGGKLVMLEPYYSFLSTVIFKTLHHEPSFLDAAVTDGGNEGQGPLSTANMAFPYLAFFRTPGFARRLAPEYDPDKASVRYFTGLSYMLTGGISRRIPLPFFLYKRFFSLDFRVARRFPRFSCAFFLLTLPKGSG